MDYRRSISKFLIMGVRLYQRCLSRFLRGSCIYYPSCSQYSIEAIQKYGAIKGIKLTVHRVLRCRSSYKGGFNPVE